MHPDLADQVRRALAMRLAVDDPQRGRLRHFVIDQRRAAPGRTPLNTARAQLADIEVDRRRSDSLQVPVVTKTVASAKP